jgi:competence protein ComEC
MAAPPKAAILLIAGGALWICFWRGRLRPWGLTAVALGVVLAPFADRADIIVEETAANVAVRGGDGRLVLADPRKGRFAAERWLTANGDGTKPAEAARRPGWICEGSICRAIVAGKRVTFVRGGSLPPNEHCDGADILIAAMPLRGACRSVGLRIDRFAVWRHGAHAITVSDDRLTVRTSRGEQGVRPWTVKRRARLVLGGRPPLLKPQRGLTAVDD